ncbi:hypothetical protein CRE_22462 [Caenorhabditis remanei]|uniref:Uncharacterized protein n=1 Tax=Caenorhabditis remanei TaxID=31234 RepID=E3MEB1_CAERE|nr:hypothetical protein CRE_22462 [Caenorhabditis remanei]
MSSQSSYQPILDKVHTTQPELKDYVYLPAPLEPELVPEKRCFFCQPICSVFSVCAYFAQICCTICDCEEVDEDLDDFDF